MTQTKDQRVIRFTSSLSLPSDTSDEEDAQIEKIGEEFGEYVWGKTGLAAKLQVLTNNDYGQDLNFILFRFLIFPEDEKLAELEEVEDYDPKEKATAVNIIVDNENFVHKSEVERHKFLHNAILSTLNSLATAIKRKKLDTKIDKLIADVQGCLS